MNAAQLSRQKHIRRTLRAIKTFKIIAIVSFCTLVMAAFTYIVMSTLSTDIAHAGGVPSQWSNLGNSEPNYIYLPATYLDQREDKRASTTNCNVSYDQNRQFEWSRYNCGYNYTLQQGIVKDTLGVDGFPVAANSTSNTALSVLNRHVTGNNPTGSSDNFYRWWHQVDGQSKAITGQTLRFQKIATGVYQYGGSNVFPLDNIAAAQEFSAGDYNANTRHNFHFTMKTEAPFTVKADGTEEFQFEGDDDVWVFLNGKLVLDIGGVHSAIKASFKINGENNITATVDGKSRTLTNIPLRKGEHAVISFFYAERSTTAANCLITIRSLEVAPATIESAAALSDSDHKVNYLTSVHNTNPYDTMQILGLSNYIDDQQQGFINSPDSSYLEYSFTPSIESSWQTINVAPPDNTSNGFIFDKPISLSPYSTGGDTVYFRYSYAIDDNRDGSVLNVSTALTQVNDVQSISSAQTNTAYNFTVKPNPGDENNGEDDDPIIPSDNEDNSDTDGGQDTCTNSDDANCLAPPSIVAEDETTPPTMPISSSITVDSPDDAITDLTPPAATETVDESDLTSSLSYPEIYNRSSQNGQAPSTEIPLFFDLVIFATSYCMWHVLRSNLARYMQGWRVKINPNAILQ
jgi:fibro-slime domain-containing protein